ncbi:hypothetical protein GPALN_005098 [Globodera pallida]|nr:hypothetical protein GPALN_005098 [Globodera pallida]
MRPIIFVVLLLHTVVAMIVEDGVKIEELPDPSNTLHLDFSQGYSRARTEDDNYLGHIYCYALFAFEDSLKILLLIRLPHQKVAVCQVLSTESQHQKHSFSHHHPHIPCCAKMDSKQITQILEANPLTRRVFHGCYPSDRLPSPQISSIEGSVRSRC